MRGAIAASSADLSVIRARAAGSHSLLAPQPPVDADAELSECIVQLSDVRQHAHVRMLPQRAGRWESSAVVPADLYTASEFSVVLTPVLNQGFRRYFQLNPIRIATAVTIATTKNMMRRDGSFIGSSIAAPSCMRIWLARR